MPLNTHDEVRSIEKNLPLANFALSACSRDSPVTSHVMESPTFKQSIAKFAFVSSPLTQTVRRSPRVSALDKYKEEEGSDEEGCTLLTPSKRKTQLAGDVNQSPTKKPRKTKRGYADPSKYAHLHTLSDCLAPDLDGKMFLYCLLFIANLDSPVLFCGIKYVFKIIFLCLLKKFTFHLALVACQPRRDTILRIRQIIFGGGFI